MGEKRWIARYDELHGKIVFRFTDAPLGQYEAELNPYRWFHAEAIDATEKDGRKNLSLGTKDIAFREAWPEFEEARLAAKAFGKVLTAVEAAELYGKEESTVKKACQVGRFHAHEARKTGKVWLVTRAGMERLYGPQPERT